MNGPILSIITVNFNNNLGLLKTLESVSSQSFSSYEHIIIDAGSTDGSRETIIQYEKENPHLSFWSSEPDKGIYDGMNKGIDHAKGQYLYFLNSGDCLSQDILAKIPFDGTEYLYGDTILFYKRKTKKRVYPDTLDLIYLSDNCFQCLIIENRTYRHLPYLISECDGRGISSNGKELNQERTLWFQNTFPATQSKVFIDCAALDRSGFRDIIHILANTHKFKKRMKTLILFLYEINNLFSYKHKRIKN